MGSNNLPIKYKETIWKKIINKIKSLVGKNGINYEINNDKQVSNNTNNTDNTNSNRKDPCQEYRENSKINIEEVKKEKRLINGTIEYALDQFNCSLYFQYKNSGKVKPYSALIGLGANAIQPSNGNNIVENSLIETLKSDDASEKFNVHEQKYKNGDVRFYHVKTSKYIENKLDYCKNPIRLYINCNRKNVSNLAGQILTEMQNDNIYLKFSSDRQLSTDRRSEAIVIYTDTKNVSNIINKIQQIRDKEPKLFENSRNMNPFLKTVDGIIGYAPEPTTDEYHKADGKIEKISKSYNTFLSKALSESFVRTAREYIANNRELTVKTRGEVSNDINFYIKYFEDFNNGDYDKFLKQMKQNLKEEQLRNKCIRYIKGLDDKTVENGGKEEL